MKVDLASMLARREWFARSAPSYRYVSFDASPQHGQEFFAAVERTISQSAVASLGSWSARPAVETRTLPLVTLGKGRMGLAEKTQAYIHQTWLEYRPSVAGVRTANESIRVCLTDMGVELAIGDAKDVVSECLEADKVRGGQRGQHGQHGKPTSDIVPFDAEKAAVKMTGLQPAPVPPTLGQSHFSGGLDKASLLASHSAGLDLHAHLHDDRLGGRS